MSGESFFLGFGLFWFLFGLALFLIVMGALQHYKKSPSRSYREHLTNLYIAGKVRQFADEDKINLDEEDGKFLVWFRKARIKHVKEIDKKIEEELNAKIDRRIEEIRDGGKNFVR